MTDHPMTPFEQRFASRLRAYGDIDIAPIDEIAITGAAAATARRSVGFRLPALRPATRLLVAAVVVAAAVGTIVVGAGLIPPPDVDPSPSPATSTPLSEVGPTLHGGPDTPSAVLLEDGRVLIVHPAIRTVETWDPRTGLFAPAGERPFAGSAMLARLGDGRVLIVGTREVGEPVSVDARSIVIYDPATGTFEDAPAATYDRGWCHCGLRYVVLVRPSLLELPDGRAMLVGGTLTVPGRPDDPVGGNHVELFDPAADAFTSVPIGCAPQSRGTQAVIPGPTRGLGENHPGFVVITCLDGGGNHARLLDLETDTFVDTGDPTTTNAGAMDGAMVYSGFRVLLTGDGFGGVGGSPAEWYDATTRTFSPLPATYNPPADSRAVSLHDARVLYLPFGGGRADIYDPATGIPFRKTDVSPLRAAHTMVWLGDGRFLALGPSGAAYVLDRALIP